MTAFALGLLLAAGFVHAGWNYLAKQAGGGAASLDNRRAVGGRAPVNDGMRCLMCCRDYGDRELARNVCAGLTAEAARRLA